MIVHRLVDRDDILANFQVLADWVEANGVDPHRVSPDWLAVIEHDDGRQHLHFLEKYRTPGGSDLIDPANPDRVWTYERSVPLAVEVPTLTAPTWRAAPAQDGLRHCPRCTDAVVDLDDHLTWCTEPGDAGLARHGG